MELYRSESHVRFCAENETWGPLYHIVMNIMQGGAFISPPHDPLHTPLFMSMMMLYTCILLKPNKAPWKMIANMRTGSPKPRDVVLPLSQKPVHAPSNFQDKNICSCKSSYISGNGSLQYLIAHPYPHTTLLSH